MKRLQNAFCSVAALSLLATLALTGCPQESKEEAKPATTESAAAPVQPAGAAAAAKESAPAAAPAAAPSAAATPEAAPPAAAGDTKPAH